MDYDKAIQVLERWNQKFEFPVNWGVDLQSEHERYLTEKYANAGQSLSLNCNNARIDKSGLIWYEIAIMQRSSLPCDPGSCVDGPRLARSFSRVWAEGHLQSCVRPVGAAPGRRP